VPMLIDINTLVFISIMLEGVQLNLNRVESDIVGDYRRGLEVLRLYRYVGPVQ
jgi:hypothetical protein